MLNMSISYSFSVFLTPSLPSFNLEINATFPLRIKGRCEWVLVGFFFIQCKKGIYKLKLLGLMKGLGHIII